jgi:hypothetical protein
VRRETAAAHRRALAVAALLCLVACSSKPPPAPHADLVRGDLSDIITIKGLPCGRALDHSLDDRLDYRVVCESGHIYRIRVTAEGQVEAAPHAGVMSAKPSR